MGRGLPVAAAAVGIRAPVAQQGQETGLAGHDGPVNGAVAVQVGGGRELRMRVQRRLDPPCIPSDHGVPQFREPGIITEASQRLILENAANLPEAHGGRSTDQFLPP